MEKCFKQFTVKRAILLHIQISGNRSSRISVPFDLIQDFQEFSVEKYAFFWKFTNCGTFRNLSKEILPSVAPASKAPESLSEWKVSQLL